MREYLAMGVLVAIVAALFAAAVAPSLSGELHALGLIAQASER